MRLENRVAQKDDLNRRIAGIIRRKREELDLTQAQLAEKANLSRTSIAFIEGAKQECGPHARCLAGVPGVTVSAGSSMGGRSAARRVFDSARAEPRP